MTHYTRLTINKLELLIHLGYSAEERAEKQRVLLDVVIDFITPPNACESDQLDQTVCYSELSVKIREATYSKHFNLVEHLTADLYKLIKARLAADCRLSLCLTKFPAIENLPEGTSFYYSDTPLC